jgi:hypothetical protein
MLQLTLDLVSGFAFQRRTEVRTRTGAVPAWLTDLYREHVPVAVLNVSRTGLGVMVADRFAINLPVLIECEGLLIVGNVRHCIMAANGSYLLGLKIFRTVDRVGETAHPNSTIRAVLGFEETPVSLLQSAKWAGTG